MEEYLSSMANHPEQEPASLEEVLYGDSVSDEIEMYNWSDR